MPLSGVKAYITGPMHERSSLRKFAAAREHLESLGADVHCPISVRSRLGVDVCCPSRTPRALHAAVAINLDAIHDVDLVVALPGWRSHEAAVDVEVARAAGIPVVSSVDLAAWAPRLRLT